MNKLEIENQLSNLRNEEAAIVVEKINNLKFYENEMRALISEGNALQREMKMFEYLSSPLPRDIDRFKNISSKLKTLTSDLLKCKGEFEDIAAKLKKRLDEKGYEIGLQEEKLAEFIEQEKERIIAQEFKQEKLKTKKTIKEQPPEIQPLPPPPKKEKIIQAPPNAFSLARSQAASTAALSFTPDTPSSTCNFIQTLTASPTWLENFCNENNYTKPDLSNPQQLTFISTTPQTPTITINPNSIKTTTLPPPETAETFYQALVTAYLKCIEGSNIKIHRITCEDQETKNQVEQLLATRLRTENPDFASSEITINDKPLTAIQTSIEETPHCKI